MKGGAPFSMWGRPACIAVSYLVLVAGLVLLVRARSDDVDGRLLYEQGRGAEGRPVRARTLTMALSADTVPCASCHRSDGRGGTEGGLRVPDLRWKVLSAPITVSDRAPRGAYTPDSLARAIRTGVDPTGRQLHPLMPRYELEDAEIDGLLRYLSQLEQRPAPGVTPSEIRIASVLPLTGPRAKSSKEIAAQLEARIEQVNARGGVHSRSLSLVVVDGTTGTPEAGGTEGEAIEEDVVRRVSSLSKDVFCFTALGGRATSSSVRRLLADAGVPLVGLVDPVDARRETRVLPGERTVFHVQPTFGTLGQSAAEFIASKGDLRQGGLALVRGKGSSAAFTAEGFVGAAREFGLHAVSQIPLTPHGHEAERLVDKEIGVLVLATDSTEANKLIRTLERRGHRPAIVAFGPLLSGGITTAGRSYVINPPLSRALIPPWQGSEGSLAVGGGHDLVSLNASHRTGVLAALVALDVLVVALEQSGRDLCRECLVAALESLRDVPTSATLPITYGPSLRFGPGGALVSEYVGQQHQNTQWVASRRSANAPRANYSGDHLRGSPLELGPDH